MLKSKAWKSDIAASIAFFIAGVFSIVEAKYSSSILFIIAGLLFLLASRKNYKANQK